MAGEANYSVRNKKAGVLNHADAGELSCQFLRSQRAVEHYA